MQPTESCTSTCVGGVPVIGYKAAKLKIVHTVKIMVAGLQDWHINEIHERARVLIVFIPKWAHA